MECPWICEYGGPQMFVGVRQDDFLSLVIASYLEIKLRRHVDIGAVGKNPIECGWLS